MAKTLQNYKRQTRPGPASKYPWEEWFNGKIWRIERDFDFPEATLESMTNLIRKRAKRAGVKVSVFKDGEESLVIQPRGTHGQGKNPRNGKQ